MIQLDKCSSKAPQWHWLLGALAREWSSIHTPAALRAHMAALGADFAGAHPLPTTALLGDLELAINQLWGELHWGQVTLQDSGSALQLVHIDSPLASAFGAAHLAWSVGLLEGIYERWLHGAGAPAELELGCVDLHPDATRHEFMLSLRAGSTRPGTPSRDVGSISAPSTARATDPMTAVEIARD
jgi:hypothetical protein